MTISTRASTRASRGETRPKRPFRTWCTSRSSHGASRSECSTASDEGPAHVAHLGPWRATSARLTWPTSDPRERGKPGSRGPPHQRPIRLLGPTPCALRGHALAYAHACLFAFRCVAEQGASRRRPWRPNVFSWPSSTRKARSRLLNRCC